MSLCLIHVNALCEKCIMHINVRDVTSADQTANHFDKRRARSTGLVLSVPQANTKNSYLSKRSLPIRQYKMGMDCTN